MNAPQQHHVVLIHVPEGRPFDDEAHALWDARRAMLAKLGWIGSVGLCGTTNGATTSQSPSPAPIKNGAPTRLIFERLGCTRGLATRALSAHDDNGLGLDAFVKSMLPGTTLAALQQALATRPTLKGQLDGRLQIIVARLLRLSAEHQPPIDGPRPTIFVTSTLPWLLIALAHELCSTFGRPDIAALPIDAFHGLGLVHGNGCWGGFVDVTRR